MLSLVLLLAVLGAFAPVLSNGFVNYDDPDYVTANPRVQRGVTSPGLVWAFRSAETGNWHPLTWLTHMSECQLFGLKPWGHHLTSLLLHAFNTVLVFLVFRRMTGAIWRSFIVAGLFGLHPLRVESVAWVAEQKDVLSAAFGLLALWAYARYVEAVRGPQTAMKHLEVKRQAGGDQPAEKIENQKSKIKNAPSSFYLLSLAFFALSLMSKPMLVTLPFVLLLLDYWPLDRFRELTTPTGNSPMTKRQSPLTHPPARLARLVVEKVPFLVLALTSSVVTFLVQHKVGAVATLAGTPLLARLANALISYYLYLGKLVWPLHLAVFYPYPTYISLEALLGAAVLLLGVSALAVVRRQKSAWLPVGWFWFLGTLMPVIGLVQVGAQSMADRYSYFPSIGVLVVLVWSAHAITKSWRYRGIAVAAPAAVLLLTLGLLTRQQTTYWHDSGSLFRHALAVTGPNTTAYWHLGDYAFVEQATLEEAVDNYRQALKLDPSFPDAHFQLANALFKQGAGEEAIREYQEALRCRPVWARAHNNFGFVLERMGRLDEAIAHLQEAVRLDPASAEAQSNLGRALYRKGALEESINHLQRAIGLNPGVAEIHDTLGIALEATGRQDAALREFQEAVRLKPDFARAHFSLALALLKQGRREEALLHLKEAVRLEPGYEPARRQLQALER
ncbi:MAG TPA: tetratricopeptide repeat protein [Candidatus Acidoferrum sp.]|nr:tetratricopeptide repeat protein [Candidatus Acidoferrum sp.]